tara:strand:+ start:283 stop:495 length:213 start_codon:yes stop_codon:yes gene_type:complete
MNRIDRMQTITGSEAQKFYWAYTTGRQFLVQLCKKEKQIENPPNEEVKKRMDKVNSLMIIVLSLEPCTSK